MTDEELAQIEATLPSPNEFTDPNRWKASAIRDYVLTGMSHAEVGAKYGRSAITILKTMQGRGLKKMVPRSRHSIYRTMTNGPLSPAHRALGVRLSIYRGIRKYTDVAEDFKISRHVLKSMEIGAHDYKLTELQRIAEVLGEPIATIITPITTTGIMNAIRER